MPFAPPRVRSTAAELRPLPLHSSRLRKITWGPICFSKIMFTDSHNVDDRLVETDAVFAIREAGIQPFHVFHDTSYYSSTELHTNVPLLFTCHLDAGLSVTDGRDCGVQELDGLETAISSANVPNHCVAARCGTYSLAYPRSVVAWNTQPFC